MTDTKAQGAKSAHQGQALDNESVGGSGLSNALRGFVRRGLNIKRLAAIYAAVAVTVLLSNSPGTLYGDNRVEMFWNPARRLMRSLTLWDPTRGTGKIREDFWPLETAPLALLRALGLSASWAQHVHHVSLFFVAALGMALLTKRLIPKVGLEHLAAGLIYGFGAMSIAFLIPSTLYLHYALFPLLAWLLWGILRQESPLRKMGVLALLVGLLGNADIPGVLYLALGLSLVGAYVVFIEKAVRFKLALKQIGVAAAMAIPVAAPALYKLWAGASTYLTRLTSTESPKTLGVASSWAESWRGLGFWLSYFTDTRGAAKAQTAIYLENPIVVWCSAAVILVSAVGFFVSRGRGRLFGMTGIVIGGILMVGGYPRNNPTLAIRAAFGVFDRVELASGMRTTYKAGGILVAGTAIMFALFIKWVKSRPRIAARIGLGIPTALVLVGLLAPPVMGHVYDTQRGFSGLPNYWKQALNWIDNAPGSGRVLVLPGAHRVQYRWGYLGDDFLDSAMQRAHITEQAVPLSGIIATGLIRDLDFWATSPDYQQGTMTKVMEILGVDYVLVRNDVDWQTVDINRPADAFALLTDPDLEVAADFGEPGENTTSHAKPANAIDARNTALEAALKPVIVLKRKGVAPMSSAATVLGANAPLIVSGDGAALARPLVASQVASGRAAVFSGDLSGQALASALEQAAGVVITDTNRRQVFASSGWNIDSSRTLGHDETLDRVIANPFATVDTQTIATYRNALRIFASRSVREISGYQNWLRPSAAFDGNRATAWLTGSFDDPTGTYLQVELAGKRRVDHVTVDEGSVGERQVDTAVVTLSNGETHDLKMINQHAEVYFDPVETSWIRITITGVKGQGDAPVGFAEVSVGYELYENLRPPIDLQVAAQESKEVADVLDHSALAFDFQSDAGRGVVRSESTIRRELFLRASRAFSASGRIKLNPGVSDDFLNDLLDPQIKATASFRSASGFGAWAGAAVDGDPTTGWESAVRANSTLTLKFSPRPLTSVEITTLSGLNLSALNEATVRVAGNEFKVAMLRGSGCATPEASPSGENNGCLSTATLTLPPGIFTDSIEISPSQTSNQQADSGVPFPLRFTEITLNGEANPALLASSLDQHCTDALVTLEGTALPFLIEATGADIMRNGVVPIKSCNQITVPSGFSLIATSPHVTALSLTMTTPGFDQLADSTQDRKAPTLTRGSERSSSMQYQLEAPDGGVFINGQSYAKRWRLTLNGKDLGRPIMMNGSNAWILPKGSSGTLVSTFGPEQTFRFVLVIFVLGLITCGWAIKRPATEPRDSSSGGQ